MKQSVVRSIVLLLVAMVWGAQSFGQEVPTPRGEIRIVDKNPNNWSSTTFNQKTFLSYLDRPPEQQTWDIAVMSYFDEMNSPVFAFYHDLALDGAYDWVSEEPELRQLYTQVLQTVDQDQQQTLIHQMERHTSAHAYFLFLYNPIQLYAVNKQVEFVPYATTDLILAKTSVTDQHWSVRQYKARTQER